jgi:SAM-dependent methyltransferase
MKEEITLLDTDLLNSSEAKIYKYWKGVLAAQPGWHYSLDIIWTIGKIKSFNLPRGAIILDAGGGYGLLQFILSAMGYNVINVDLASRKKPLPYLPLFRIENYGFALKISSAYMAHLQKEKAKKKELIGVWLLFKRIMSWQIFDFIKEIFRKNSKGLISLYKADFSDLKFIRNESIDAIVSVSSIEHLKSIPRLRRAITEFERVLKPMSPMIITTSASENKSWYHKPSNGWCFGFKDINIIFKLEKPKSNFEKYREITIHINQSRYLRTNLPSYYFYTKNCGMPHGVWDVKYIPVGIIKWSSKSK